MCLALARTGPLPGGISNLVVLLGVWAAGLLGALLADERRGRFDAGALTLAQALWCNVGLVLTALLVPHFWRLLLLVGPLMCLIHAALHLDRAQVLGLAFATWLAYLGGVLGLIANGSADPALERQLGLAFTGMLGGMSWMALEVTALRSAFERRRERLREAMEQLAEFAMRDELTGLANRRCIMDVLAHQKALADRGQLTFTVCYCDLDHFKTVNDRFGHQQGDRVLKDFARVLEDVVRAGDFLARFGGEEFLLVLVGADAATARGVAERLCERTRQLALVPEAPDFRLTVSVGVASFVPGERIEDVIQRADLALYSAKSLGRDRIVLRS